MPFQYRVYTDDASVIRGTLEVSSQAAVEGMLWHNNYYIVDIQEVPPPTNWREVFPTMFGVKVNDVIIFTRQLATLVKSGVSLVPALLLLRDQVPNPSMSRALDDVVQQIEMGNRVSETLAKFPLIFPDIYCRMVEVGERTGHLDQVLEQVAVYLEKRDAITGRIRGALMYPLFIIVLAAGIVGLLVTFALPAIVGIFKEFNVQLPWTTRLLMEVANLAQNHYLKVLAALALGAVLFTLYARRPEGRRQIHAVMLRLPIVGQIVIKGSLSNFTRSMAVLLQAGIPLPEAIDLSIQTVDNVLVRQALQEVRTRLLQGHGLAYPLSETALFPKLLGQMVRVGEESGSIDAILLTLADFYEQETDQSIDALTSKIEPALILFVGGIVGFIAIAVLTPMYSLIGAVK